MTILIGLTGGIACGKSAFSELLKQLNIPVIDCDVIAREVVEPNTRAYRQIVAAFQSEVPNLILENGKLNRKALGELVFSDDTKRLALTNITGPAIFRYIMLHIFKHVWLCTPLVVIDAPTLYETKFLVPLCRRVIVIATSEEVQLKRLMKRDSSTAKEAQARIAAQMPLNRKIKMADYVLYNNTEGIEEFQQKSTEFIANVLLNQEVTYFNKFVLNGPVFLSIVAICATWFYRNLNKY